MKASKGNALVNFPLALHLKKGETFLSPDHILIQSRYSTSAPLRILLDSQDRVLAFHVFCMWERHVIGDFSEFCTTAGLASSGVALVS